MIHLLLCDISYIVQDAFLQLPDLDFIALEEGPFADPRPDDETRIGQNLQVLGRGRLSWTQYVDAFVKSETMPSSTAKAGARARYARAGTDHPGAERRG
jgi:hypothetical protein